ncbi:MAG: hypothetical protein CL662_07495 [Bacteroidetes bacterium]|jgi:hypothetical protein|nr:hypothetical protein [Bacteroidota bacterium]|tara:strand:- start:1585 stop:2301 length:717 start_codon:yes stop_codon:yes gene_type:complete
MDTNIEAYNLEIKEGKVRIVFNVQEIQLTVSNAIAEFFSPKADTVKLHIDLGDLKVDGVNNEGYDLTINIKDDEVSSFSLPQNIIWFDVDIAGVSNVLNNSVQFKVEGNYPELLSYFIKKLDYKIEWLQFDKIKKEISTVSVTKKSYAQSRIERNVQYSLETISRSAELLNKAIHRIDLRTRSAYLKLNTENGKLDPVIISIAEKLGYEISVLDEETIEELKKRGQKATHLISLVINY